ncbi:SDR family oxidoreductase [Chromobacterium sp. IIBBL 290-4]|uniref:SDR family oxidoreductase n=1 Tax=Chromobacterium sp. IIBBL 290-4 TaxID=2953890 RepID=UPI0020B70D67|nr:SDR family oxidoreductase [Chromobacterium sp. IIBBL 290-4]UTH73693.1 SDR family oxidoreductase [Chromobacterium sp. IIBBL 290-4]
MNRLQGKHTLITGGTSGIGLATARAFLAEGAHVAITGRSQESLEAAKEALGPRLLIVQSDAGKVKDQVKLPAQLRDAGWDRLDAVYINAGDVTHQPVERWREADFDRVMSTNLKGPFFLLQALLPMLAKPSSVILCGSTGVNIGLPDSSVYVASKAGLMSLARSLSGEWLTRGIRVNCLTPGPTETPAFGKTGLNGEQEARLKDAVRSLVPLGRLGRPEELAQAAVFLASDESQFMLGSGMLMDGGTGTL